MQMEEIVGDLHPEPTLPAVEVKPGQIGVVAVAAGKGLADIFRSLGAAFIVNGGQTNNPSTEEIYQAIQDVPTDKIIILPNNQVSKFQCGCRFIWNIVFISFNHSTWDNFN